MAAEYIQILRVAMQNFTSNVHDSFGERVVQDVFEPSDECLGKMYQLEEENSKIISEIQISLEETQEAGKNNESCWEAL